MRRLRAIIGPLVGFRGTVVLPPAPPGSLGDEAVLTSVIEQTTGMTRPVCFLAYGEDDGWPSALAVDAKTFSIAPFLDYQSLSNFLGFVWRVASARKFLVCGTDVLDGHYSVEGSLDRINLIAVAASVGADVRVIGVSFNATADEKIKGAISRLPVGVRIFARDEISLDVLRNLGNADVRRSADPAFLMTPAGHSPTTAVLADWITQARGNGKTLLGMNVNHFLAHQHGADGAARLVERYAELIEELLEEMPNLCICLLPHDRRGEVSDFDLAAQVRGAIQSAFAGQVCVLPREVKAAEVKGVVSQLDAVFTGKMHLAIAALGACVPVAAIVYKDKKFLGLFKRFGLEAWLLPEDAWQDSQQVKVFVQNLLRSSASVKTQIEQRLPEIRTLAREAFADHL